jgi:hypothetical protein
MHRVALVKAPSALVFRRLSSSTFPAQQNSEAVHTALAAAAVAALADASSAAAAAAAAAEAPVVIMPPAPWVRIYAHDRQRGIREQEGEGVGGVPAAAAASSSSSSAAPLLTFVYTNQEAVAHEWIVRHILGGEEAESAAAAPSSAAAAAAASSSSSASASARIVSPVVGFDAEWKPTFQKGQVPRIGTIQLGTERGGALVVQINALIPAPAGTPAAGCLGRLLDDPRLTFVGMGIAQDFNKVRAEAKKAGGSTAFAAVGGLGGGRGASLCDLKTFGTERGVSVKGGLLGLAQHVDPAMAKWKSNRLQTSDWSAFPLSEAQVRYAGMDAVAAAVAHTRLSILALVGGGGGGGGPLGAGGGGGGGQTNITMFFGGSGGGGGGGGHQVRR